MQIIMQIIMEEYFLDIPFFVFISVVITGIVFLIRRIVFQVKENILRYLCLFVFCVYLLFLYSIVIGFDIRFNNIERHFNLLPFVRIVKDLLYGYEWVRLQIILNIFLTVPFGFLFPILNRKSASVGKILLWTTSLSAVIEVFQFWIGRSADINDLLLNSLGGIIGYSLLVVLKKITKSIKDK